MPCRHQNSAFSFMRKSVFRSYLCKATLELLPGSDQHRLGHPGMTADTAVLQKIRKSSPWRAAKNRHCADMTQKTETKAKAGAVIIPVTLFEQNCTLIWCEATKKAVVIDPGGDVAKIQAAIKQANVSVEKI